MALPHFLGIGAQKAATSWLWKNLGAHPDVWMPPFKELHYFDHLYVPAHRAWTTWGLKNNVTNSLKWYFRDTETPDLDYVKYLVELASDDLFTEAWYASAYAWKGADGKLLGEITPEYCMIGREGIAYVRRFLGNIKLIYFIRDPVDRAFSQLFMNARRRKLSNLNARDWDELFSENVVFNRGDYRAYVPEWESVFQPENILYIPYGAVGEDPKGVLSTVEDFLKLRPFGGYPALGQRIHQSAPYPVPEEIREYVESQVVGQVDFLVSRFGEDFVSKI
jgi:hypothetical protein